MSSLILIRNGQFRGDLQLSIMESRSYLQQIVPMTNVAIFEAQLLSFHDIFTNYNAINLRIKSYAGRISFNMA